MSLILTPLKGIPLVEAGDDLSGMIVESLCCEGIALQDGDVIVIAQKVVSKAEGRRIRVDTFVPSDEALALSEITGKDNRLIQAILEESKKVIRAVPNTLIAEHKNGFICANAGIDHSNVNIDKGDAPDDWILLLPEDADLSASEIRAKLESVSGKNIGVLIVDSHGRPWRLGTVGMTIGVSGMPALVDMRGNLDLFGRELMATQVAAADELAAGASLMMGQAAEASPVVHVRGFPYALRESGLDELIRCEKQDLFR
jgi:coenzyme F420-0:L-glutamate ligase / coenzyme F420-1:gamma-L-glutamate ligase